MKTKYTILFLLFSLTQLQAQIISTYAGGGGPGDGGAAPLSRLDQPSGTAVDSKGNIYITEYFGNRLRKISIDGIITTVAGSGAQASSGDGGLAKNAQISNPTSVAIDRLGNIYVAEFHKIRKITTDGIITTVAGNDNSGYNGDGIPATSATLYYPSSIAVDSIGNLYISDINNYRLRKVDTNGIISTIAGTGVSGFSGDGGPATAAKIYIENCIAIDGEGNIILADGGNYRIRKINKNGIISTIAGTGVFDFSGDGGPAALARISYPSGLTIDKQGNIFFSDRGNGRIRKINTSGIISTIAGAGPYGFSGDGGPALNAKFAYPEELATDAVGNILIADKENFRLRKIDMATGIINTIAGSNNYAFGGDSIAAMDAELKQPTCVATDLNGNVYVSDFNNVRIRRISKDGIIVTVAGGGTNGLGDGGDAKSAQIYSPMGITVDRAGNLYIADRDNNRVRKVSVTGIISTIAGTGIQGFSGDGGPAVNAQLFRPYGVAVDTAGNIFISDQNNYRIRKIGKDGVINTVAGTGIPGFSGDGGDAKSATLTSPAGLAADKHGNIFIADQGNYRIRKIDRNNIITTLGGGGGDGTYDSVSAMLTDIAPSGVAVDAADNVYINDLWTNHIRKISPNGIITSFAGNGYYFGYSGDGGDANQALLYYPTDVVSDLDGNIYISDQGNNRVRKVTQGIVALITGDTSVCKKSASPFVTFTYTGSSQFLPYTFTYRINDGAEKNITTVSGKSVSIPVPTNVSGSFVYTLVRVTDNKLYTTIQKGKTTVTVGDSSVSTITASGPVTNICPGKTLVLTASTGKHYIWNTGDTTASIQVTTAGRYAVSITNVFGCNSVSSPVKVTYESCVAPVKLIAGATSSSQAKLKWKAVTCAQQYKVQYRKSGTQTFKEILTLLPTAKLKRLTPGAMYEWQVTAVCDSIKNIYSSYSVGPNFTMPATFANDNISNEMKSSSSNLSVIVIPNPVQYNASIQILNAKGITTISLTDMAGKTIWQSADNHETQVQLPVQQLAAGIYIVTVTDGQNKTTVKLIKQ